MRITKNKLFICIVVIMICVLVTVDCSTLAVRAQLGSRKPVLLIDAGHGGIDGGAVSSSGVAEKDINLAIARNVKQIAEEDGWQVVMTRDGDDVRRRTEMGTIRSKKMQDLNLRREIISRTEPDVAVSIHLNSFREDISVNGVQVFYPGGWQDAELSDQCREFAETMQKTLIDAVDSEKERTALPKDGVFILKDEVCPIVIVECGFLSNPAEAEMLQTKEHQHRLAKGIMAGIVEFTGIENDPEIKVIDSYSEKNRR